MDSIDKILINKIVDAFAIFVKDESNFTISKSKKNDEFIYITIKKGLRYKYSLYDFIKIFKPIIISCDFIIEEFAEFIDNYENEQYSNTDLINNMALFYYISNYMKQKKEKYIDMIEKGIHDLDLEILFTENKDDFKEFFIGYIEGLTNNQYYLNNSALKIINDGKTDVLEALNYDDTHTFKEYINEYLRKFIADLYTNLLCNNYEKITAIEQITEFIQGRIMPKNILSNFSTPTEQEFFLECIDYLKNLIYSDVYEYLSRINDKQLCDFELTKEDAQSLVLCKLKIANPNLSFPNDLNAGYNLVSIFIELCFFPKLRIENRKATIKMKRLNDIKNINPTFMFDKQKES